MYIKSVALLTVASVCNTDWYKPSLCQQLPMKNGPGALLLGSAQQTACYIEGLEKTPKCHPSACGVLFCILDLSGLLSGQRSVRNATDVLKLFPLGDFV